MTIKTRKPLHFQYVREPVTIGDHIKNRRLDLKLLQKQVAEIIGVTTASIVNWELNHKVPDIIYLPKIIEFLGFVPFGKTDKTLGERIITCRKILGLSQEKLAQQLKVDWTTLRRWERNKSRPSAKHIQRIDDFLQQS